MIIKFQYTKVTKLAYLDVGKLICAAYYLISLGLIFSDNNIKRILVEHIFCVVALLLCYMFSASASAGSVMEHPSALLYRLANKCKPEVECV